MKKLLIVVASLFVLAGCETYTAAGTVPVADNVRVTVGVHSGYYDPYYYRPYYRRPVVVHRHYYNPPPVVVHRHVHPQPRHDNRRHERRHDRRHDNRRDHRRDHYRDDRRHRQ